MFYFGIVYTISFTLLFLLFIFDAFSKRNTTYLDCIKAFFIVVIPVLNTLLLLFFMWDKITSDAFIKKLNKPIFKNKE